MSRPELAELLDLTSPATRARQQTAETIPVLEPLAPLLPDGGLARGTVTEVGDAALLLALASRPAQAQDVWTAVVDLPDLGLAAAGSAGVPLDRVLLVDDTEDYFAEVVATLAGACRLLLVRPPAGMPERVATRLAAHLRRHGAVLLAYGGHWPGAQLRLDVTARRWTGLGDGHGQLLQRHVEVAVSGRGAAARGRTAELLLPDERGRASLPEAQAVPHTGPWAAAV